VCGALAYEGGTTAEACEAFAAQSLAAGLRRGDIVVRDRLSSHSDPAVLEVFRGLGVQVKRLPAYSPDLNPIEKAW
jgi:transposase